MKAKFPTAQVLRIVMTVALLVAIIVLKQRCGATTAQLFQALDTHPDGGTAPKALTPVDAAH